MLLSLHLAILRSFGTCNPLLLVTHLPYQHEQLYWILEAGGHKPTTTTKDKNDEIPVLV